jgi:hypothetical protein
MKLFFWLLWKVLVDLKDIIVDKVRGFFSLMSVRTTCSDETDSFNIQHGPQEKKTNSTADWKVLKKAGGNE